jgi:hypothetical protein
MGCAVRGDRADAGRRARDGHQPASCAGASVATSAPIGRLRLPRPAARPGAAARGTGDGARIPAVSRNPRSSGPRAVGRTRARRQTTELLAGPEGRRTRHRMWTTCSPSFATLSAARIGSECRSCRRHASSTILAWPAFAAAAKSAGRARRHPCVLSYELRDGTPIWIITEADRAVTTILLPEEY